MLDSLVRVTRRDRQTTHALDCNTEQCQTTFTDNQYRDYTTVTRPYNPYTRLVEIVDRAKLLFAFNNRKNSWKPRLKPTRICSTSAPKPSTQLHATRMYKRSATHYRKNKRKDRKNYAFMRFRIPPASPSKPEPSRRREAGSGVCVITPPPYTWNDSDGTDPRALSIAEDGPLF